VQGESDADSETVRRRVRQARVARLASMRPDGRPHIVPCCFALEGEVVYSVVDAKPKSTLHLRRLENVRANPSVALLVDHYTEDWTALWWIRLDGTARVIESGDERDRALGYLCEKYPQYVQEPPPGAVISIDVTTWRAWP
jgi:PPOX class probable F420-dependent enzyme